VSPRSVIKKEDGFLAYYFSAQIANGIVRVFARLPIRPNHYTFVSLLLGFAAAYLFTRGAYQANVAGLIILHLSFILDCCDGQVSRLKGLGSKMGHWFDYHSDKLKDGAVLLGLAYGTYHSGDAGVWIFIVAYVTIFFQFLRNITALNRDNFTLEHEGKKDTAHTFITDNGSQLRRTLKHSALFKLSDRILLYTIMIPLGLVKEGIVLYALLETAYALLSAFLNYRLFHRFDKKHSAQ
jgi:phosphatidylglycerophosphate synthase